jgi:DNA repair photolyase
VSDPYQAIERKERLTRRCLETIRQTQRPWTAMLLTRSTLILEDLALLSSMPRIHAGVSIPTINDDVRKHFEPRAASIPERLHILRSLRKAGIPAVAIVQPLLDGSPEKLADALAENADSVSIDVLRGVMDAADDFADPRYAPTREPQWQITQARTLAGLLGERGIRVRTTELPPELMAAVEVDGSQVRH